MADSCSRPDLNFSLYSSEELLSMNMSEFKRTWFKYGFVYEHKMFSYTATKMYNIVCDRNWIRTIINIVYMFGYLVGALGSGMLADRFGRRPSLIAFGVLGMLSHLCCALAPCITYFILARFTASIVDMGTYVCSCVCALELMK
jgi:MFS family permease